MGMNVTVKVHEKSTVILRDEDVIDFTSAIPYYYQLTQYLETKINSGQWGAGQKLPSEKELCDHFNISRTVVRQALNELASNNLIETYKGKGSFISSIKQVWQFTQSTNGLYSYTIANGKKVHSKVLELEIVPAFGEVAEYLQIEIGAPVTKLKRLRYVDDEPIVVVTEFLPEKLCPGLVEEDFSDTSLYELLVKKYNLVIAEAVRDIESVNATPDLAELLQVNQGAALTLMKSISWLSNGTPLDFFIAWHRGDRHRFQVRLVSESERFK